MSLRLEIECIGHHQCDCRPIAGTRITSQQVTYNLIRCNPALAKYFYEKRIINEKNIQLKQSNQANQNKKSHLDIVEQKRFSIGEPQQKGISIQVQTLPINFQVKSLRDNFIQQRNNYEQNRLKKEQNRSKDKLLENRKQKRNYYHDHKQQSRYLADSAFKKYFDRPVFCNYGNQNTHSIIQDSNLKTHNINPHSLSNAPNNSQAYHNALVKANVSKLNKENSRISPLIQRKQNPKKLQEIKKKISKQKQTKKQMFDYDIALIDNVLYHQKIKKYQYSKDIPQQSKEKNINTQKSNTKSQKIIQKFKNAVQQKQSEMKKKNQLMYQQPKNFLQRQYQSKVQRQIKIQNNQVNYVPQKKFINRNENHHPQKKSSKQLIQQIKLQQCPVIKIQKKGKTSILSKNCNRKQKHINQNKKIDSPIERVMSPKSNLSHLSHECNCKNQCKCCPDKIKKYLQKESQSNPDLKSRLITSAKKTVLYKNYSLNNEQNAYLNPQNYRQCCGEINLT